MVSSPTQNYKLWIRERFPTLNRRIDEGDRAELSLLLAESGLVLSAMTDDSATDERERFTYISMIHAALYHHRKRGLNSGSGSDASFDATMERVEGSMIELARTIGVEHRFLSVFYLFCNPQIPDLTGKYAQFHNSEYEATFIRINREGTRQYQIAAKALTDASDRLLKFGPSKEKIAQLFQTAASAFRTISSGNAELIRAPGSEEFRTLTQYFGEVRVAGGPPLRGVNAGDQPWSYVIDLLLGVDLKHVFEVAFEDTESERHYPDEVITSADVVAYEFQSGAYLHANYLLPEDYKFLTKVIRKMKQRPVALTHLIPPSFSTTDQIALSELLHDVIKQYVAASNVHFQLARRFVPQNAEGEQVGSAGTHIMKFLREGLNAEREKVKHKLEARHPNLLELSNISTL